MASIALLQHYFEYLKSPPVLLAFFTIVGPILLEIFKNKRLSAAAAAAPIPDCYRLGALKQSYLNEKSNAKTPSDTTNTPRVKALFTYPVKSCKGIELAASQIIPTGLKYDRSFTFAQRLSEAEPGGEVAPANEDDQPEWRFITQREFPRLALIETELWLPKPVKGQKSEAGPANGTIEKTDSDQSWSKLGGCLVLRFPFSFGFDPLGLSTEKVVIRVPLAPNAQRMEAKNYTSEILSIWVDHAQAINVTGEIPSKDLRMLQSFIGLDKPIALFRVDLRNQRKVTRSLPKDRDNEDYSVGFADAFPIHLLNVASVQAQDDALPLKANMKDKLDARRFRANIYISGAPAYEEDTWKRVKIGKCIKSAASGASKRPTEGDGEYHVACRTARCKLPNVDQNTGIKDNNEPSTTLSKTRKVDKGAYPHPCLGMQVMPLFEQGILRVGDEIQVVERGEHVYEKMFA